jgi:ribonuclease HI
MRLLAYIDGASRGNPGESGIGVILKDENGNTVLRHCEHVGTVTNNIAEYLALLACIEKAAQMNSRELIVHSDSELLVKQIKRKYKVRDRTLQRYFIRVFNAVQKSRLKFNIVYIPRGQNKQADALANEGIEKGMRAPN